MQLPLNTMALTCLIHGSSYGEEGSRVRVIPERGSNETVLFFVIDDKANEASSFRQDMKLEGKICDLIIFFSDKKRHEKILCLVELKRGDEDDSVEKIINTRNALMSKFDKGHLKRIKLKAYVHTMGGSHRDTKKNRADLIKVFDKKDCDISGNEDMGKFLRG
jgi:serine/threonine protein kinase